MKYQKTDERYKKLKQGQKVKYKEDNSEGIVIGFSVYGAVIDWGKIVSGNRSVTTEPPSSISW